VDQEPAQRFVMIGGPDVVEAAFVGVADRLRARYALTLFAGARHRAPFVRHPAVHAYVEGDPGSIAQELDVRPNDSGNLVLIRPRDEGVFFGAQDCDGVRVASDVQLYVDLSSFEARGREQAEHLLDVVMKDLRSESGPEAQAGLLAALKVRDEADKAMRQSEHIRASDLYEDLVRQLSNLSTREADREFQRAHLLLWVSLARAAFDKDDSAYLERARSIYVTDAQVEEARRAVGYAPGRVALALLAYYGMLTCTAAAKSEQDVYRAKTKTYLAIATSEYTDSHQELRGPAQEIWSRLERHEAFR